MRHVPLALVLAVLPVFACQSKPPLRQTVSLPPPEKTSEPEAAAPPPALDVCARSVRDQHARVAREIASSRAKSPSDWTVALEAELMSLIDPPNLGVSCASFAGGAWALEISELVLYPGYHSLAADLEVVAYGAHGRTASATKFHAGYGATFTIAAMTVASDYDGDGFPELYVRSSADGIEGGHYEEGKVYAFHHGIVEPYAPASFDGLGPPRDIDADGRLDLPTSAGIELGGPVVCMGKSDWDAADFIAHALADGTFSTNDDVAKKYALGWCPSPPSKVTKPVEALCARLWATTPAARAAARKLVTSACTPWDCALDNAQKPQAKTAKEDCQPRIDAFDSAVPFTLP